MKPRTYGVMAVFAATVLVFYLLGYAVRPVEDWSSQHVDEYDGKDEFRNSFLGLRVCVPKHGDWVIESNPERFRFKRTPGLNKILEMELMGAPQWARVDVFVQPVHGGINVEDVLKKLEFRKAVLPGVGLRTIRPGFTVDEDGSMTVGGRRGFYRVGMWTVDEERHHVINYYARANERLYSFVCVCKPGSFETHRPTFDSIVHMAEVD